MRTILSTFFSSVAHLVSRHPFARRKERHIHNLARLVRYKGRRRCGQIKSAPLRRSRTRHDQAPLEKSGRGAQSVGTRSARYTLRNRPPSFSRENWSFSFEARYTVTRITLFRFADTTSMSVSQSKDFPGARESTSSPAVSKINVPAASAPRTATVYHFSSHAVNRRAQKIKSKIAKIAKTSKSRHEFSGMASQRANRIFSSRQNHALKYIDSTQYLGKVAALPTEVLVAPYRGIGRTLPRYWLRPTEVLVAPYRGIGRTIPRY